MHATTETTTTVGYAGGAAAHSAAAAEKLFPSTELLPLDTFVDVVNSVLHGDVSLGVLPIESSLAGSVAETHDLLWEHPISIVGETSIPIKHLLVAREPIELAEVRVVRSHPMGLEQCRNLIAPIAAVTNAAMQQDHGCTRTIGCIPNACAVMLKIVLMLCYRQRQRTFCGKPG